MPFSLFATCGIPQCSRASGSKLETYSPYVGQGVPAGSQVVVATQLADAALLSLHPGLRRRGGARDHVLVLVTSCGACCRDAPARTPARPAAAATRGRRFLVRSAEGIRKKAMAMPRVRMIALSRRHLERLKNICCCVEEIPPSHSIIPLTLSLLFAFIFPYFLSLSLSLLSLSSLVSILADSIRTLLSGENFHIKSNALKYKNDAYQSVALNTLLVN